MATFQDNVKTIQTATYGKEMRPAISEALTQSWDAVKIMMRAVDQLNERIDALPDPGGGSGGDSGGDSPSGSYVISDAIRCIDGAVTPFVSAGDATPI